MQQGGQETTRRAVESRPRRGAQVHLTDHFDQQLLRRRVLHVVHDDVPQLRRPPRQLLVAQGLLRVEPIQEQIGGGGRVVHVPVLRHGLQDVALGEGDGVLLAHDGVHCRAHGRDDLPPAHPELRLTDEDQVHGRGGEPLAPLELLLEDAEGGGVPSRGGGDQHAQQGDIAVGTVGDVVEVRAQDVEAVEEEELGGLLEREGRQGVREGDVDPVVLLVVGAKLGVLDGHRDVVAARDVLEQRELRQEPPRTAPDDVRLAALLHVLDQAVAREELVGPGIGPAVLWEGRRALEEDVRRRRGLGATEAHRHQGARRPPSVARRSPRFSPLPREEMFQANDEKSLE